ncbi:MAG: PEGA domain-containing protein [Eubacterium sp.]|nr:PEGA domain-containing protein [Eubacterium sp.]
MKKTASIFILFLLCALFLVACGKNKNSATAEPNSDVSYENGSDLTGVVKDIDRAGGLISFYNPVIDGEETFIYTGATSVQTKNGSEMSMDEVELGEVYDIVIDKSGGKLAKMTMKKDVIEETDARIFPDSDRQIITVEGVNYAYSEGVVALSGGQPIDPMEITSADRVTFRGGNGKVYSVIVTRGHGYLEPEDYADFVGGTLMIEGESILPVTEGMLVVVPEGRTKIKMRNGDLESEGETDVSRNMVAKLNMKQSMSQVPDTARVTFHIHPDGAELYINGSMVSYSEPIPMYYGLHSVRVVLEGYNTYQGTIRIKDPEPTFRIDLAEEVAAVEEKEDETGQTSDGSTVEPDDSGSLDPSNADYDVDHSITVSAPNGASIYINGTYKGVAPCSFTKCIGQITITLQKEGCQTKSYSMEILDDSQDTTLSFPELAASE